MIVTRARRTRGTRATDNRSLKRGCRVFFLLTTWRPPSTICVPWLAGSVLYNAGRLLVIESRARTLAQILGFNTQLSVTWHPRRAEIDEEKNQENPSWRIREEGGERGETESSTRRVARETSSPRTNLPPGLARAQPYRPLFLVRCERGINNLMRLILPARPRAADTRAHHASRNLEIYVVELQRCSLLCAQRRDRLICIICASAKRHSLEKLSSCTVGRKLYLQRRVCVNDCCCRQLGTCGMDLTRVIYLAVTGEIDSGNSSSPIPALGENRVTEMQFNVPPSD